MVGATRDIERRSEEIRTAFCASTTSRTAHAHGTVNPSAIQLVETSSREIALFGEVLANHFAEHQSATDVRSPPGLRMVRAPGYSASSVMIGLVPVPKSPKNHAGTSPITNASDRNRVVLARVARHRR